MAFSTGSRRDAAGFLALISRGAASADAGGPRVAVVLTGLAAIVLFFLEDSWVVTAFVVLFGFGYAARDVVTPLAIADCYGAGAVAQVYGLLMLTFLVSPLGPILGGLSFDRTGSYAPAIIGVGVLLLVSFFSIFLLRDERAAR